MLEWEQVDATDAYRVTCDGLPQPGTEYKGHNVRMAHRWISDEPARCSVAFAKEIIADIHSHSCFPPMTEDDVANWLIEWSEKECLL